MTIKEYEAQLQKIDPKFEIVQHPNNPELAGLYYDRAVTGSGGFIITVPANEIREEYDPSFTDSTGHPHNWISKINDVAHEHLRKLVEEPGYKENMYEPLDFSGTRTA